MVPTDGPDRWSEELLDRLPRQEPPPIPLEAILERWRGARRRRALAGGLLLAAALLLGVLLQRPAVEPPVHLNLQIIEVAPADEAPEAPGPNSGEIPTELQVP
jgi:hypothetical protein